MNRILLVFLTFISINISAQQWVNPGATWHYNIGHAFAPYNGFVKWHEDGQVMKNGKMCWVLKSDSFPWYISGHEWSTMYTYEDSGRVYWLNETTNQFTVLYDFNKKAGESWTMEIDSCQFTVNVDSVKTVTLGGILRKAIKVSSQSTWFGWCYEGIGNQYRPYPDITFSCYGLIIDEYYYRSIRCYDDNSISTVHFDATPDCDYVGLEKYGHEVYVEFFPNPVHNFLSIRSDLGQLNLVVYNVQGNLVDSKKLNGNTDLDVSQLPPGIYFCKVLTERSGQGSFRFVKE